VIDTGIDWQHPDLNVVGASTVPRATSSRGVYGNGDDDHYHGTHVAGTIGALDNGSASWGGPRRKAMGRQGAQLQGIRLHVLDRGRIDWVAARSSTMR